MLVDNSPGADPVAGVEPLEFRAIDRDLKTPLIQQWNVGIQQEFGNWVIEARYVGTRGQNLLLAVGFTQPYGLNDPNTPGLGARARLDGHAQIGLGPTFFGGRYQVPLREDVTFAFDATSFLSLRAGLGLGVVVDATRSSMSYGEVGVPVGATFFDAIELVYRPYLGVPFSSNERATFGGTREVSAALAVVPFDLTLRFRISELGF